jgi:hypothetical protein
MRSDVDVCDSIHEYTTSSLGSPVSYIWIQYMSSLPHVSMDAYRCTSYEAEDTLTCFFTPRDAGGETTRTCTYSRTSRVLEEAFVTVQYSVQMCACTFAATVVCSRQAAGLGRIKCCDDDDPFATSWLVPWSSCFWSGLGPRACFAFRYYQLAAFAAVAGERDGRYFLPLRVIPVLILCCKI